MKILMRADTHVNIEVPGNAPVAKCTFSQVSFYQCEIRENLTRGYNIVPISPSVVLPSSERYCVRLGFRSLVYWKECLSIVSTAVDFYLGV